MRFTKYFRGLIYWAVFWSTVTAGYLVGEVFHWWHS